MMTTHKQSPARRAIPCRSVASLWAQRTHHGTAVRDNLCMFGTHKATVNALQRNHTSLPQAEGTQRLRQHAYDNALTTCRPVTRFVLTTPRRMGFRGISILLAAFSHCRIH